MKSKYVVGEVVCNRDGKQQLSAVVFPECVDHSEMGRRMFRGVVSAGFVDLNPLEEEDFGIDVICFGRSESLNLESMPEHDAPLVRKALGLSYS